MQTPINYNPDVLTCLANLSNDEVFTPPSIVNQMLDQLPASLWSDKNTKFLDPACKTGVFLREIAVRLNKGLETVIPDQQERINHIYKNQLYGLAITELTSLLSRRSVYCSKTANGKYSVCTDFDSPQGNITYKRTEHVWREGRCTYCGASQSEYDRDEQLETHAYRFIHTDDPQSFFKDMKFDVIIGNPPYQLSTSGGAAQATPLYHKFVIQAKKMNPRFVTMIIPSRWFAGGMGLDDFRQAMLTDARIRKMTDFINAKECFPGSSIGGGVNYFLWDRDNPGQCEYRNFHNGKETTSTRNLSEYEVFVRYNEALSILRKVTAASDFISFSSLVSSLNPFGFGSAERGDLQSKSKTDCVLYSSKGVGYVPRDRIIQGLDYLDKYKVMISKVTSEHAGEPGNDGSFKVFSKLQVLAKGELCTFSYFVVAPTGNRKHAINVQSYLKTRFARFLLLQAVTSINLSREKFIFVPSQDYSREWTDEDLYKKYMFTKSEIAFIESLIRPME